MVARVCEWAEDEGECVCACVPNLLNDDYHFVSYIKDKEIIIIVFSLFLDAGIPAL